MGNAVNLGKSAYLKIMTERIPFDPYCISEIEQKNTAFINSEFHNTFTTATSATSVQFDQNSFHILITPYLQEQSNDFYEKLSLFLNKINAGVLYRFNMHATIGVAAETVFQRKLWKNFINVSVCRKH